MVDHWFIHAVELNPDMSQLPEKTVGVVHQARGSIVMAIGPIAATGEVSTNVVLFVSLAIVGHPRLAPPHPAMPDATTNDPIFGEIADPTVSVETPPVVVIVPLATAMLL